jgi:hypothetical protein
MKQRFKKGRFAMINQGEDNNANPFIELASKKYRGESLRLFLFYMGVVEYDNKIPRITQVEIAEILNIAVPNICVAKKALLEDGIIYKDGRDYYLDERFLLKGMKNYKRV